MHPTRPALLLTLAALAGCATAGPPAGPQVIAMPSPGKSYDQFTAEDSYCRQAAYSRAAPGPSAEQANANIAGSTIAGGAIGAAAGALIGSASRSAGTGALVGGAVGALTGAAVGNGQVQSSGRGAQYSYDVAYTQCMAASGNQVPATMFHPGAVTYYPAPAVPVYGYYGYGYGYRHWRGYP